MKLLLQLRRQLVAQGVKDRGHVEIRLRRGRRRLEGTQAAAVPPDTRQEEARQEEPALQLQVPQANPGILPNPLLQDDNVKGGLQKNLTSPAGKVPNTVCMV